MEAISDSTFEGKHRGSTRPARELDWKSLPCVKLPLPMFRWDETRRKSKLPAPKDFLEVKGLGWRLLSIERLRAEERPDIAFRRFHPIASGLLMLDDLGNARGCGESKSAALRYDRAGRLVAKAGFAQSLYRLGLHPLRREFIVMSSDCVLQAYDEDLRLLWQTNLAEAPQIQALRRRFPMEDEWLKNHIRGVAFARDRSRYLFAAVDEVWCVNPQGETIWGLKLPLQDGWSRLGIQTSAGIAPALALLQLELPVTPEEIRRRYHELAMRWHPDRNDSGGAHERMTELNSAIELLSDIDARILAGVGDRGSGLNYYGSQFTVSFDFGARVDADWVYAVDFAADSDAVYIGSYSGRVVKIDSDGEARQVYQVGIPPRRIIDMGRELLYILTRPALYILRQGSLETMIDMLDGGELVMAYNGFGVLETKRLRWFDRQGRLLGTIMSSDPIRRIYQSDEGLVIETRLRRATIGGPPPWWR